MTSKSECRICDETTTCGDSGLCVSCFSRIISKGIDERTRQLLELKCAHCYRKIAKSSMRFIEEISGYLCGACVSQAIRDRLWSVRHNPHSSSDEWTDNVISRTHVGRLASQVTEDQIPVSRVKSSYYAQNCCSCSLLCANLSHVGCARHAQVFSTTSANGEASIR